MSKPIESYWDLLEPYWDNINIYDGPEQFAESIADVPDYAVLLYSVHMRESETCNGGFSQLFFNSTGLIVPNAIEGYKVIGMPEIASLVGQTAEYLGEPYPLDRNDRWKAMAHAAQMQIAPLTEDSAKDKTSSADIDLFRTAARNFPFRDLERRFYDLIRKENGGFEEAATLYARSIPLQ